MAARAGGKKAPRKKAGGYKMPPPMPAGELLTDAPNKKKWRIGPSIGVGGFGEIYSACDDAAAPKSLAAYPYVAKIEPHENGPLFVEKHFYSRNANRDDISNFMKEKKLSSLGMPTYHGSGSHTHKGENYRYLILERYGKDIWKQFKENGNYFPVTTVFQLGVQMLDVLQYIHSKGYVHADLKGANILLGLKKGTENQAYLVDFGLAKRVTDNEFKPDPKSAHNGTIEYTSRDAHLGAPTMRGDLEILGYNMLQWIVGKLPWETSLQDPKKVQQMKENFMSSVKSDIKRNYPSVPDALIEFFEYINTMKPKETPNYLKCRRIFECYLKSQGCSVNGKLVFTATKTKAGKGSTLQVNEDESDESESEEEVKTLKLKAKKTVKTTKRKSSDSLLVATIKKKTKLNPRVSATPPLKKNHANIATQTSLEKVRRSPRCVTFDSPVSAVVSQIRNGRSYKLPNDNESSPDVFEDSFEVKPRRRKALVADQKVTVTKKLVRKTVKTPAKSWKDIPTIMNGRPPIKNN